MSSSEFVPTRTVKFQWFFKKALDPRIGLPTLMLMHDNCAAVFKALAVVAHRRITSPAGLAARVQAEAQLQLGAIGCSAASLAGVRMFLQYLDDQRCSKEQMVGGRICPLLPAHHPRCRCPNLACIRGGGHRGCGSCPRPASCYC